MQKRYQKRLEEVKVNTAAVLALDDKRHSWVRCQITQIIDENRVEVVFVDVGGYRIVHNETLVCLKSDFAVQPFALQCQLSATDMPADQTQAKKIAELFQVLKRSSTKLQAKTLSCVKTSHTLTHFVNLYIVNGSFKLDFNAILAGLSLAQMSSPSQMNEGVSLINAESNQEVIEVDGICKQSNPARVILNMSLKNKGEFHISSGINCRI